MGEHSKTWTYESDFCPATVSLDYAFDGWHELTRYYRTQGWTVVKRRVNATAGMDDETAVPYVTAELSKPSGEHGYVVFGLFDEQGRPVSPPATTVSFAGSLLTKIRKSPILRLLREWEPELADYDTDAETYQVQVFACTDFRLSQEQRSEVLTQFHGFGRLLRGRWESAMGEAR
jgi:hypothetical protein